MALTLRFLLTVIVTVVGASFQFYSFAVLNTTQEIVEGWVNQTYIDRGTLLSSSDLTLLWSFVVSILPIGGLIGSAITSLIAENCGRKNGLVMNGFLNVFAGFLELISKRANSPEMLMLGRLLLGINTGLSCGLAPMYLTEIAPIRWRGAVGASHQIAAAFGDWFCMIISLPFVLGGVNLWPLAVSFPAAPALVLCLILPFCPESPRFLLLKVGDKERAKKSIEALVGNTTEAMYMMEDLETEGLNLRMDNRRRSIMEWVRKPELYKPLFITFLIMLGQQFTGIAAVLGYSSEIFVAANLSLEVAQLATVGVGACYFLCTIPALWLIELLGRRTLVLLQQFGCLVCLILLTLFITLNMHLGFVWASYGSIGVVAMFMIVYGIGSPIPWLIASELFSQEYRSCAVAVGTFTSFTMAFVVSTFYLPFQASVGPAMSFLPFIVVSGVSTCGIYMLLPETKNRRIDQIVEGFQSEGVRLAFKATKNGYNEIRGDPLMPAKPISKLNGVHQNGYGSMY